MTCILEVSDRTTVVTLADMLAATFTKEKLQSFVQELCSAVPGPYLLSCGGKPVSHPEWYFPQDKKLYAFRSRELAGLAAVFLHRSSNLRRYLLVRSSNYVNLIDKLLYRRWVSFTELLEEGFGDMFENRRDRYSYSDIMRLKNHDCWFMAQLSYGFEQGRTYYRRESFIALDPYLKPYFAMAMARPAGVMYSDTPPDGTECVGAEGEAAAAYPVFQGLVKQDAIKFSAFKVTAASSYKAMEILPVIDISIRRPGHKENLGLVVFPVLEYVMSSKPQKNYPLTVKKAVDVMLELDPSLSMPMLLPLVKGFRHNRMFNCRKTAVVKTFEALDAAGDRWMNLDAFFRSYVLDGEYVCGQRLVEELDLYSDGNNEEIILSNLERMVDYPMIQAFCAFLYGLGAAQLALLPVDEELMFDAPSPFSHIAAVRLTPLGQYVFGHTDSYERKDVSEGPLFRLDEDRLVIRSLSPGNAYESLLKDTAEPIGANRFIMNPRSFLKHCSGTQDVQEKIQFFRDYISPDPPAVWKEFFDDISSRIKPLRKEKNNYVIYSLESSSKELMDLICSDAELKSLVIKAEGYRILVPDSNHQAFVNRLKTFGYLL